MIWACFDPHNLGHVVQKYSEIKCEVICPELKPWPKLDHATGRRTAANLYQHCWNQKEWRCCNGPDKVQTLILIKMLWWDLKSALQKQMPTTINELKQRHVEESMSKFLCNDMRDCESYRKLLLIASWLYKLLNLGCTYLVQGPVKFFFFTSL